jgi:cation transport ATPase
VSAPGAAGVLHETARRLRVSVAPAADLAVLRAELERLPGVRSVRVNAVLRCVIVQHDGEPALRAAVLERVRAATSPTPRRRRSPAGAALGEAVAWAPALLAATVPVLPRDWRRGAALAVVVARVASQAERLRSDPAAVLLDATSLASLAISGQPLVVSASVLLRLVSERISARFVRQADGLLDRLLPTEALQYLALREPAGDSDWAWLPLRALRAGDRIRLQPGDVVPVDGCVVDGAATLTPAAHHGESRRVGLGVHLAAGERLQDGSLELRAEADTAASRLERMRAHVRHAIASREPAGRMAPDLERLLSLPLTAATLVFGLTGDTARAGAMLQADPRQGLDLALPVAREAALYALARQGLLTAGLETIERLATARTLVLQDTGVLAGGRWTIEAVHTEPGGDAEQVRRWLAALADTPLEVLAHASLPDRVVRQWVRHGAVLRVGDHELHLASRQRVGQVWGHDLGTTAPRSGGPLRRELAVMAAGRVVARVSLVSALRPAALDRLAELATLGFERMAVFVEADGAGNAPPRRTEDGVVWRYELIADDTGVRTDWLAEAARDGTPLVIAHTVLRDLVPPGSLSLAPMDADAGAHGVLLDDPLASLVAARRVARAVHRRLRLQQGSAVAANAALMTAAALRWLPPIGTSLLHHGFASLLLLDSLRVESLDAPPRRSRRDGARALARPRAVAEPEIIRSETV